MVFLMAAGWCYAKGAKVRSRWWGKVSVHSAFVHVALSLSLLGAANYGKFYAPGGELNLKGEVVMLGEEEVGVGDGELVVHVGGRAVVADVDADALDVFEIGPEVFGFEIVGDDADRNPALQRLLEFLDDAVIGDGEDADLESLA